METTSSTERHAPDLELTRILDAPRQLVFDAFTRPEHLVHWWGPKDFTLPTCEIDFRVGGKIRFCMRSPEGTDYWSAGEYLEIVPPERLVFSTRLHEYEGKPGPDTVVTVTLEDRAGKTFVTMHQTFSFENQATRGARQGWGESFDRLSAYLATR